MAYVFEPDIEDRIEEARKSAQKILNGEIDDVEEFRMALANVIATARGMGIFDTYFEKRTIDQLVFEAELVQMKPRDTVEQSSTILKKDQKAAESLFDDWEKEDAALLTAQQQEAQKQRDQQYLKDMEFMETNKFQGEGNDNGE